MVETRFSIDFYRDASGAKPVLDWLRNELEPYKSRALGVAIFHILQQEGIDVCRTEYGKNIGAGLFEFRLRHSAQEVLNNLGLLPEGEERKKSEEDVTLRVLCHAYGDKVVLLLAGYDKGNQPSKQREQKEIALAQKRLQDFLDRSRKGTY